MHLVACMEGGLRGIRGVHLKMASDGAAGPAAGAWNRLQQGEDGGAGTQGPEGSHRQAYVSAARTLWHREQYAVQRDQLRRRQLQGQCLTRAEPFHRCSHRRQRPKAGLRGRADAAAAARAQARLPQPVSCLHSYVAGVCPRLCDATRDVSIHILVAIAQQTRAHQLHTARNSLF